MLRQTTATNGSRLSHVSGQQTEAILRLHDSFTTDTHFVKSISIPGLLFHGLCPSSLEVPDIAGVESECGISQFTLRLLCPSSGSGAKKCTVILALIPRDIIALLD